MNYSEIWGLLGIEPTDDKKAIKRAYARQSRNCHPEEHPDEFDKLHQAYQAALELSGKTEYVTEIFNTPELFKRAEKEREERCRESEIPYEELISKGAETEQAENVKNLLIGIEYYHGQDACGTGDADEQFREKLEKWLSLFRETRYAETVFDEEFLKRLCQWMKQNKGMLSEIEITAVYIIYDFKNYSKPFYQSSGPLAQLYLLTAPYFRKYKKTLIEYGGMGSFNPFPKELSDQFKDKKIIKSLLAAWKMLKQRRS